MGAAGELIPSEVKKLPLRAKIGKNINESGTGEIPRLSQADDRGISMPFYAGKLPAAGFSLLPDI